MRGSGGKPYFCADISNHGEVYIACKQVSAHWRDVGARLGVLENSLASIELTHKGEVERCLSAMLDKWLRRPRGETCVGVLPTWRDLCIALSSIDRTLAEALALEHGCNYISTTGN